MLYVFFCRGGGRMRRCVLGQVKREAGGVMIFMTYLCFYFVLTLLICNFALL